jgi:hypothetical protein
MGQEFVGGMIGISTIDVYINGCLAPNSLGYTIICQYIHILVRYIKRTLLPMGFCAIAI